MSEVSIGGNPKYGYVERILICGSVVSWWSEMLFQIKYGISGRDREGISLFNPTKSQKLGHAIFTTAGFIKALD